VNEPGHATLGHCRNRLLDFAEGELCRTWDDDDFYLPWTLSQGIENIGSNVAWKPARSWWADGYRIGLAGNAMEASILFRTEAVKNIRYRNSGGDEHAPLLELPIAQTEMHHWASYCFRWGQGQWHISGSLGRGSVKERTTAWMAMNREVYPDRPLVPNRTVFNRWCHLIGEHVPEADRSEWLTKALSGGKTSACVLTL
jgi:hypothetical protein